MYSYVARYDYSQITAASDWPRLFCTLGVFVLHMVDAYMHTYMCTYIPIHTYIHMYTRMYVHMYVRQTMTMSML